MLYLIVGWICMCVGFGVGLLTAACCSVNHAIEAAPRRAR